MDKKHPIIGCCGIGCGLCPRFHADGTSRCPGCGGEGFDSKHPACSNKKCCADKHGLEICSQCPEFPCKKFEDREKIERDSFVTHKRIFDNHEIVTTVGLDVLVDEQNRRFSILKDMLRNYDDGRSKSFFCIAAALLSIDGLKSAVAEAADTAGCGAKELKAVIKKYAEAEGIDLSLRK